MGGGHLVGGIDVRRVEEFATALDDALNDVQIERTRRIVFVYDADVVIGIILGATAQPDAESLPNPLDPRIAVRSLLGAGTFGELRMLRPHLLEFDRVVTSLPRPATRPSKGFFAEQRDRLRRLWQFDEIEHWLHGLGRQARNADGDVAARISGELAEFLEERGFETFVVADLCFGGTWFNRLPWLVRRKVITFDALAAADRFDLQSPGVGDFRAILDTKRPQPWAQINNVVDAAALDVLGHIADAGAPLGIEYRLYSETEAVREVLTAGVAPTGMGGASPRPRLFFRSAVYFLVRSSFPCLRPRGAFAEADAEAPGAGLSEQDLGKLLQEIRKALGGLRPGDDVEQVLARYSILGKPLSELLSDFFRMSYVRAYARGRGRADAVLEQMLPALLATLQEDTIAAITDESLGGTLERIRYDIGQELGELRKWRAIVGQLRTAVARQRERHRQAKESRSNSPLPSNDLDLGLVRWGLDTRVTQGDRLTRLMEAILTDVSGRDEMIHCADVASLFIQDRLAETDAEYVLLALWWLKEWPLLVQHWDRQHLDESTIGHEFRPLVLVARARHLFERASYGSHARQFVREVEELLEAANAYERQEPVEDRRAYGSMCLAHVGYWCWQVLNKLREQREASRRRGDLSAHELTRTIRGVAEQSYDAGKRAYDVLLPSGGNTWLFAINHCAYLGTIADIRRDETELFLQQLSKWTTAHDRNFRIADTLAKPHSETARRIIKEHGIDRVRATQELKREVLYSLEAARTQLRNGLPFFGDEEANAHLDYVQRMIGQFT